MTNKRKILAILSIMFFIGLGFYLVYLNWRQDPVDKIIEELEEDIRRGEREHLELMKEINPELAEAAKEQIEKRGPREVLDEHQIRFMRDYWHIISEAENLRPRDISGSAMKRWQQKLIDEYWKIEDPDIGIDVQHKDDLERLRAELDEEEYYDYKRKVFLYEMIIDSELSIIRMEEWVDDEDIPRIPLEEFHQNLRASRSPIDQAVLLERESRRNVLTSEYERFWLVRKLEEFPFKEAHAEVMKKLEDWQDLSKQTISTLITNLSIDYGDYYKQQPEVREDLLNILEKMVYETNDLSRIPITQVVMAIQRIMPRSLASESLEKRIDIAMHYLESETGTRRESMYMRGELEILEMLYEDRMDAKRRDEERLQRAQRSAAHVGIELPDNFEDAHTAIIELLNDPEQPDKVVRQMLYAAGHHLAVRHYRRDDERRAELIEVVEELLYQYDKRDLNVNRYLQVYRFVENRSDAFEAAERILQKRTEAGLESPKLEKWIEEREE